MLQVCVLFRVRGNARHLSHAETLRVFRRALVRAGIPVAYSGRFNPRCRLSLPLPRPVGVETDADVLSVYLCPEGPFDPEAFIRDLAACLPAGFRLLGAEAGESAAAPRPVGVTYRIPIRQGSFDENLRRRIELLAGGGSFILQRRRVGGGSPGYRRIDAADFLESVEICAGSAPAGEVGVLVDCAVGPRGSLRVEEILGMLDVDTAALNSAVRRTSVKWERDR
jgi:radical SAM-linked protein